ncbi:noggin-2-like [Lethenteron reissneri]|uniref:noggin-2-like n=1 Tax=Lethenteron reissneri TaxID=7753 RepID=UPI002AB65D9A|nr:noggin-2-like [Lethenteron reissneri]
MPGSLRTEPAPLLLLLLPLLLPLLLLLLLRIEGSAAQHFLHLRPVPSEELPLTDLIEYPDPELDPKAKDLDERVLRRLLGSHFDPTFMSVAAPGEVRARGLAKNASEPGEPHARTPQHGRVAAAAAAAAASAAWRDRVMPSEIRDMDFARAAWPDPRGSRAGALGRKARRKMQLFLWAYTQCPVAYAWKDLGARFWPRYVREGSCQSGRSCSIPAGMSCKAQRSTSKAILRWYCRGWGAHRNCTWLKIQYPIIAECRCSC